jgi:F1F0 ATPase subunit 2
MDASLMTRPLVAPLLGLAAGLCLGFVHFATLRANTRLFTQGRVLPALLIQLARFALLVLVLALLARLGALSLLCGALGLFVMRGPVLRKFGTPS